MRSWPIALLLGAGAALASSISAIPTAQMVQSSPTIVIGKVTGVAMRAQACQRSLTIDYAVTKVLKGHAAATGTYRRSFPIDSKTCPTDSYQTYLCPFDDGHVAKGTEVIFYDGSRLGPGCDAVSRRAEVAKIIATPLTVAELIGWVKGCAASDCTYIVDLAAHGKAAVAPLGKAMDSLHGTALQAPFWVLGRIRAPESCALLEAWASRADDGQAAFLMQAIGDAGCVRLASVVRKHLATASDPLALVAIDAVGKLKDTAAIPLLDQKLFDDKSAVLMPAVAQALGRIGDKMAVPALCGRRKQPASPSQLQAIASALAALKAKC